MAPSFRSLTLAILLVVLLSTTQLSSLGAAASESHNMMMLDRFHRWMSTHGRTYQTAGERLHRFEVYRRNVEFIEASNRDAKLSYKLGENQFTDLSNEEFVSKYANGTLPPPLTKDNDVGDDMVITTLAGNVREGHGSNVVPPVSFDWRAYGVVTPVKNQNPCGSCWAFSAVATVESLIIRYGGPALDLSEQELVDCDKVETGCKGGWPNRALEWIRARGGLVSETSYGYVAKEGACRNMQGVPRAGNIQGVVQVTQYDELALQWAVWLRPVSVTMYSNGNGLQHYAGGVFHGPCTSEKLHAIVFVGWGVDADGVKYWIAKNSWVKYWIAFPIFSSYTAQCSSQIDQSTLLSAAWLRRERTLRCRVLVHKEEHV